MVTFCSFSRPLLYITAGSR